jgi:transcriptional regulator with XRE-family HTH domain
LLTSGPVTPKTRTARNDGRSESSSESVDHAGEVPKAATRSRGPYRVSRRREAVNRAQPSDVLAANLRSYRVLRHITQDELALRMDHLGHGWGRSTVSAVEGKGRNVTIDEIFGLAVCLGVTVGQLVDPSGPDHARTGSLDVGLTAADGSSRLLPPGVAQLWAAGRAVVRLWHDDGRRPEVQDVEDLPMAAQRALQELRSGRCVLTGPG